MDGLLFIKDCEKLINIVKIGPGPREKPASGPKKRADPKICSSFGCAETISGD